MGSPPPPRGSACKLADDLVDLARVRDRCGAARSVTVLAEACRCARREGARGAPPRPRRPGDLPLGAGRRLGAELDPGPASAQALSGGLVSGRRCSPRRVRTDRSTWRSRARGGGSRRRCSNRGDADPQELLPKLFTRSARARARHVAGAERCRSGPPPRPRAVHRPRDELEGPVETHARRHVGQGLMVHHQHRRAPGNPLSPLDPDPPQGVQVEIGMAAPADKGVEHPPVRVEGRADDEDERRPHEEQRHRQHDRQPERDGHGGARRRRAAAHVFAAIRAPRAMP